MTFARFAWGAALIVGVCRGPLPLAAQFQGRVPDAPSDFLPPVPAAPFITGETGFAPAGFDAFAPAAHDNRSLRPWHTRDIEFGSWGSPEMWEPSVISASTINRYRKRFVQRTELNGGWLDRPSADSVGYSFASASVMMVVPLASEDRILAVTPRFRTDWLEGPDAIDVPARVYSATLDVGLRWKLTQQVSLIGGVQPGWFSDGFSSEGTVRWGALAAVSYELVPERLTLLGGIARLDRNDFDLIPVAGVTWIATPDLRFDLTFPRPRIARRVGHVPFLLEDWAYVGASFGGGSWSVRRDFGIDDELTLFDYRIAVGLERILDGGTGFNVEVGYVFGRQLEYQSSSIHKDFDDSFLIEAGLRF